MPGALPQNPCDQGGHFPAKRLAGNGKGKALYESWGYTEISSQQPSPDGPVLTAMARPTRATAPR